MIKYPRQPKKVIVVIDTAAGVSAREVMSGIFKFVNAGHAWSLRIIQLPTESLANSRRQVIDDDIDGMIVASVADESSRRAIAAAKAPAVFVDVRHPLFENRAGQVAFIRNDNEGIGTAGAKYLASLGSFNSFGFVPTTDNTAWSSLRQEGFRRELKRQGMNARVFSKGSVLLGDDRENLVAWLKRLPKPTALMCAFDYRAVQVCEACCEAGLRIPEQVAILGVDNDELLCLSTTTPLSSIRPDHVGEGFHAAAELSRLFRLGSRANRREIFCRAKGIVERESTKPGPPTATLIRRAMSFIEGNVRTNLRVETVAAGLGVSRRLLEKRFREVRNESVHAYILSRRLSIVRHLLTTTRRTSAKIAAECGFPSVNSLSHIFVRETGRSMREWRDGVRHEPQPDQGRRGRGEGAQPDTDMCTLLQS